MEYKNPASAVDLIVEREDAILLIRRGREPFKGKWALPGGHLDCDKESLEEAGVRELVEETGLVTTVGDLALLGNYSHPRRDPRGHVISHTYVVKRFEGEPKAGDDAAEAKFFPYSNLPELAFDHGEIIGEHLERKGGRI